MNENLSQFVCASMAADDCCQRALDQLESGRMNRFESDYVTRQVVQARALIGEMRRHVTDLLASLAPELP